MAVRQRKAHRLRAVLELVDERAFASQRALAEALARRGFEVTQATLSRDLRQLGIVRIPASDGVRYAAPARAAREGGIAGSPELLRVAELEVRAVECNENLVLVRTMTGRAQGVAVWIDGQGFDAVLGTVAGDDTILVVPRSARLVPELRRALAERFGVR